METVHVAEKITASDADVADFEFIGGYPSAATIQKAYDEADLNRAIMAYRFFYPAVSMAGIWKGNLKAGAIPNKVFAILDGTPQQLVLTPNSDTRYAGLLIDLRETGPMVVEVPAGPIMAVVNDLNQLYVMDIGLPGPDKGKGGKHVILPPGYEGVIPSGHHTGTSTTYRVLLMLRALPLNEGGPDAAEALMKSVKVYPVERSENIVKPRWVSLNQPGLDFTALSWEDNMKYWMELHDLIDTEPPHEPYRAFYGELAELGIEKGKPFAPDARLRSILAKAAKTTNAIMRVQSFADRRPERLAWNDRQWEWAALRSGNGSFETPNYTDLYAREKWFYQAVIESPAMFNRSPGAGSLYWLAAHDSTGAYLDGGKTYRLTVPLPVPAGLFWSVTVYDTLTRSEILTGQNKAALRSLYELKNQTGKTVDLFFGPDPTQGEEDVRIKTIPARGWFAYFRIYGPEQSAFDGAWKPGDFEIVQKG